MKKVKDFINFLNLLDRGGKLSLTNLAVVICLFKIALAPAFSLADMGVLLLTLLNYAHKRTESYKVAKEQAKVVAPNEDVESLKAQMQELKTLHDTVSRQAEETKNLLAGGKLAAGMFGGRTK